MTTTLLGASRRRWTSLGLITLACAAAIGCGDDSSADGGNGGNGGNGAGGEQGPSGATLELSLTNLEPLAGDFEYEGWFVGADGPVSAGRFNLAEGETTATVSIDAAALEGAETYVLTIEPPADEDEPAPSATHILAGSWDGSTASLTIGHEAALGDDFSSAAGQFMLAVPTASTPVEYSQGIWFLDPSNDPPTATLDLPELPEGWAYEGWVAGPDGPVSTGVFVDAAGADSDGGGPAAGDQMAPPFPGQDFVDPATDLLENEMMAVISVEPVPDDSAAPFAFKPLLGAIGDAGQGVVQDMDNTDSAPSGTVTLSE